MCDCYFDEELMGLEVTEKQEEPIPVPVVIAQKRRK
jgi:hypothetical protein